MVENEPDRNTAILMASMQAFSRYGYSRTTMDDIAEASGVPRTALYRNFRSKEHIFRALAEYVHADALMKAVDILNGRAAFEKRLANALIARDTHLLHIGHSGPHADEIAELYLSLAGDLAANFNQKLVDVLAEAIRKAVKAKEYKLPPSYRSAKDFAMLLRLALEGVKKEVKAVDQFEPLARQLIKAMSR